MCGFKFVPPVSKHMPLPTRLIGAPARLDDATPPGGVPPSVATPGRYDRCAMPASRVPLPLRHREKRARAQPLEVRLAVEFEAELQSLRKLLQQAAIAARIERVWRQRRQPAGEIVAGGGGERQVEIRQFSRGRNVDARQALALFRLALEGREAKGRRLERRDGGIQCRMRRARAAALLPQQQRLRVAVQGAASELARRLQALEGAGLLGHARHDQQGLRLRRRPANESNRRPCAPCARTGRAATRRAATRANPRRSA